MKEKWKAALSLLFGLLLLYFFIKGVNVSQLLQNLKRASLPPLIFFALSMPLLFFLRAVRWRILFMGKKTDLPTFTNATILGFALSYMFPGRIGELARALYVSGGNGVPASFSIATVVVERFFDAVSVALLLGLYLLFSSPVIPGLKSNLWTPVSIVGLAALVFAIFILLLRTPKTRSLLKKPFLLLLKIFPHRHRDRIKNAAASFVDGLDFLFPLQKFLLFLAAGLGVWLFIVLQYWVAMKAFGIERSFFSFIPYIGVLIIGAAIPTPGMAGGFDVASRFFIEKVWHYPAETAVAATFVVHILLVGVTILLGAAVGMKEGLNLARREK